MTWRAGSLPAVVAFASPVSQPPSSRHCSRISGPPARWIVPSTPPPPSRLELAALTIASTACSVMSPRTASITNEKLAVGSQQARGALAAQAHKRLGDHRVELRAGAALDLFQRTLAAQRRAVGPRRGHRVVCV